MEPLIIIYAGLMFCIGVIVVKKINDKEEMTNRYYKKRHINLIRHK